MTATRRETRHVPLRRCVACGNVRPKASLLRLVRGPDGDLSTDARQRAPGRGAYVCREIACWTRAVQRRLFSRALRSTVSVSASRSSDVEQLLWTIR